MTAKQKAEEMKEMFDGYLQYAERAVDQMLYTVDGLEDSVWCTSATDFLKEVKQKLEKL